MSCSVLLESFQWMERMSSPGTYSRMSKSSLGSLPWRFCIMLSALGEPTVAWDSSTCTRTRRG